MKSGNGTKAVKCRNGVGIPFHKTGFAYKYFPQFSEYFPSMSFPNLMSYSRAGLMTPPGGNSSRCYSTGDQLADIQQ